jgi:hypothetical protein
MKAITFRQLTELLDRIDDECLAEHGQTLGLGVCGTAYALAVMYECVLWDSEEEPTDDPEELKQHLIGKLKEMVAGIETAVATLKGSHEHSNKYSI